MAVNTKPTEGMAAEAQKGLDWSKEHGRGGTRVGKERANQIVNRENLSERTINRMVSFFARHEGNKKAEGFRPGEKGYPSNGRIAWALWGGDPGQTWAKKKQREFENEREKGLRPAEASADAKLEIDLDILEEKIESFFEKVEAKKKQREFENEREKALGSAEASADAEIEIGLTLLDESIDALDRLDESINDVIEKLEAYTKRKAKSE